MKNHPLLPRFCLAIILSLSISMECLAHGDTDETSAAGSGAAYPAASSGTRTLVQGPVWIKMLADASNLGRDDIEVGELFLPVAYGEGAAHAHGSLEIFYVIEGVLGHEVNGHLHRLEAGMLGFVKPGDNVRHSVLSDTDVRAVVIWMPGGESQTLLDHAGFTLAPAN